MYTYFRKRMEKCQNPSKKDSDEGDNRYLVYFSNYSLIHSKQVSMTTRKYVDIPEISCSDLGLPTDGVYPM